MDIETRLQQVATVINQIDDPKVPRNIRRQAKEACEQWLLNKAKKLMYELQCPNQNWKSCMKIQTFLQNLAH